MKNRSPPTSRNAIKHGLYACDIILRSPHLAEDRADYEELLDSLVDEFKPKGILQKHLVLKIANSLWRYRRVINAETARINRQLETTADHIDRGYYSSVLDESDDPGPCTSPLDFARSDMNSARSARNPFMGAARPPTHPGNPPFAPIARSAPIQTHAQRSRKKLFSGKRTHFR